ncbi:MAG: hypothetical protein NTV84_05160 [Methanoregula sp.]|nr:hypothetical protein [Methanoregula sp.]
MLAELTIGILLGISIFIIIILAGSDLFAIMVNEQIRYLRLIVFYAPLPGTAGIPSNPEPVARYLSWALKKTIDPVGSVHIRHTGRFRYGKAGRWMNVRGEAFFSLATPGFVWHAKIAYAPGIWIDVFDYYVHRDMGMNLNLLSVFPLDNAHGNEIKPHSLFRYLASIPLFPMAFASSDSITWKNIDDSTAKAIIRDADLSIEAIARFDGRGWIESIEACEKTHPETGRPLPGLFESRFSGYTDVEGCRIPMQIASELILPDGEYVCAEYTITGVEYNIPDTMRRRES